MFARTYASPGLTVDLSPPCQMALYPSPGAPHAVLSVTASRRGARGSRRASTGTHADRASPRRTASPPPSPSCAGGRLRVVRAPHSATAAVSPSRPPPAAARGLAAFSRRRTPPDAAERGARRRRPRSANWATLLFRRRGWRVACDMFPLYGSPKYGILKWSMDGVRTEFQKYNIPYPE